MSFIQGGSNYVGHRRRNLFVVEPPALGKAVFFQHNNGNVTVTNNGKTANIVPPGGSWDSVYISDASGAELYTIAAKKMYFEIVVAGPSDGGFFGFVLQAHVNNNASQNPFGAPNGASGAQTETRDGLGGNNGVIVAGNINADGNYVAPVGMVWGVAIDGTTGNVFFSKNGVFIGAQNPGTGANPALTLPSLNSTIMLTVHNNVGESSVYNAHLGGDFSFALPAGYVAWNSL